MISALKRGNKNKKVQDISSISFVYQKQFDNSPLENEQEAILIKDQLPISRDQRANESIISSFLTKPQFQNQQRKQTISHLEWAAQQSSHQRLINDLSAENQDIKITKEAQELLKKQKYCTIIYTEKNEEQSALLNNWVIRNLRVIEPSSQWLLMWNTLMAILIIAYFYLTVINLYFSKYDGDQDWYWDQWHSGYNYLYYWMYALIMVIDLIIEFHVAYFEKGCYVTDKISVYKHYLKNGFIFDCLPLIMIYFTLFSETINRNSIIRFLIFLKFNTLKIYDLRIEEQLQLHRKSKASYLIFKMIVEILLLVQFFAAIFYRVGIHEMDKINAGDDSWQSWLDSDNLFMNIYEKPLKDQYLLSLYWSVGTLTSVSYGDITPMNPNEIAIANLAMICAIFLLGFNVQTIYEVYSEYKQSKKRFQKHLIAINRFMRDKQISPVLQNKIRKYLDHIWMKERAREQKLELSIIDSLAPQLKQDLYFESYGLDLVGIPWFSNNFSFEFIKQLSMDCKEVHFSNEEVLFRDKAENDDDNSLYIIKEGEVELYINPQNNDKDITKLAKLQKGAVFGQYSFITGDGRTCSAKSTTYTTLYRLSRTKFLNRLMRFEADYERYCQIKDQVSLGKEFQNLNLQCFTCKQNDHLAAECPLTHYTSNSQKLVFQSLLLRQEQIKQQRQPFSRSRTQKEKKMIVDAEDYDDEDNPFLELEQYYQQYESQDIDRVQSFYHYFPRSNIDYIHRHQINQMKNFIYFTPVLKHQQDPV